MVVPDSVSKRQVDDYNNDRHALRTQSNLIFVVVDVERLIHFLGRNEHHWKFFVISTLMDNVRAQYAYA